MTTTTIACNFCKSTHAYNSEDIKNTVEVLRDLERTDQPDNDASEHMCLECTEDHLAMAKSTVSSVKSGKDNIVLTADQYHKLHMLARQTLKVAFAWNDHNYKHPLDLCKETCRAIGITSSEAADDFLDKLKETKKN